MAEKSITIHFVSDTATTIPEVSWIKLEQSEIPLDQEAAKASDVYAMLGMASFGQSARAYKSGRCPVTRSIRGDTVVAQAKISFYVHSSPDFAYTIQPSEGKLSSIPFKIFRKKQENIKTEYREQFQLGWLPLATSFSSYFLTSCYDKKRKLVTRPKVVQNDGFIYVKGAVWSMLRVTGMAVCDKWSLTIEHEQGTRFARSIYVDAVWYVGDKRKSERLELKLPGCVEAEFNKCPYEADPFDLYGDGQGDGSDHWDNLQLNYSSARIVYSPCDGKVLEIYEDEDK